MDNEKIQSLISQLKGVGLGDEEILDVFYAAFQKGKMDRKDLETLADSLGYELDDDFKEDKTPDPIEGGEGKKPEVTPEAAEDLKEIKPGESKEEFKEKVDEAKGEIEADADDKKEDHEDKEWEEANKYFKI
jgi:hypothetical protein